MTRKKKIGTALLVAGLSLGLGQSGWAGTATAETPTTAGAAVRPGDGNARPGRPVSVTLLTGDRVSVAPDVAASAAVFPAKGREQLRFVSYRAGGDLYVIPQDAAGLVGSGRLDRRLFDVTGLIRLGYDDAGRNSLPLIVRYHAGAARPSALTAHGGRVTRDLPAVDGAGVLVAKDSAAAWWPTVTSGAGTMRAGTATGIDRIWLDGRRHVVDDRSTPQVGAPVAWQAGYTGTGTTVAVLDTGIDATHPDLAGKVVGERNFSADPNPADAVGHGTHVASIIAGTGAASKGSYKGVAPDAKLLDGKVCESEGCSDSAILAGMQWAAADQHAKVVNISIGGPDTADVDPLEEAVNSLTARYGTLFVLAAGNSGPNDATVSSPGSADAALTVGAVDAADQLAPFSSRGPRPGDDAIKPDITAPGVDIIAAKAAGTEAGEPVGDAYVRLSGTSMATPHVTGSVAILAQQHPDWTAARFKAALMASARPNPTLTPYEQGAGRVDVGRAISQNLTSEPASLSLGRQRWPHGDDQPITKTVTYHNAGTAAVTLDLGVQVTGPGGVPAPAGMFTTSASRLTVPAGGQAPVNLTADTRVAGPDGRYSGSLVATTADGARIGTPVGVGRETESYDLTVTLVDRAGGAAATNSLIWLTGTDEATHTISDYWQDPSGIITLRLPKGRYDLSGFIYTPAADPEHPDQSLVAQPALDLTTDTHLTLDARTAKPVTLTVPDPSARAMMVSVGYSHATPYGTFGARLLGAGGDGLSTAQRGPVLPSSELRGVVGSQWGEPGPDGGFAGSPYFYSLAEFPASLPTGFVKHYRQGDLTTVRTDYGTGQAGYSADVVEFARSPLGGNELSSGVHVTLPGRITRYLNDADWIDSLWVGTVEPEGYFLPNATYYARPLRQVGREYREHWYGGPFGPVFDRPYIIRTGDDLSIDAALFSDAAGHAGWSDFDSASTTLYRDGVRIGQFPDTMGDFTLPADPARYRLESQATRTGYAGLSSTVKAAWTFRSGHSGAGDTSLPLMAVRFTPPLNADNQAPPGKPFTIPVTVQTQAGAAAATVRQLTVEVSYDDGKTWQPTRTQQVQGGWSVTVQHPAGGGFVSLRATAADSAGNTVEQSIIHAYGLSRS